MVKLHFHHDLSAGKPALTLGLSINTVGPPIDGVKKRIRQLLEGT